MYIPIVREAFMWCNFSYFSQIDGFHENMKYDSGYELTKSIDMKFKMAIFFLKDWEACKSMKLCTNDISPLFGSMLAL